MAAFAECAKANSLWVVINCRQQNKQSKSLSEKSAVVQRWPCVLFSQAVYCLPAVNECLNQYTTEEQFEAWKAKRTKDLAEQAKIIKP